MKITLTPDGPLDADATLARYRLWGEDPANRLVDGALWRVLRLGGRLVPYAVRAEGGVDDARLELTVPGRLSAGVVERVAAEVRRLFGLDFDLGGFYRMAKAEPVLGPLTERLYGLRPTLAPTPLEMLVGAITAQQVNLAFAFALRARLVRRWGAPVRADGVTVWAFPAAATLARARVAALRGLQFSARKAAYLRGVARALASGALDPVALGVASNEAVVATLTAQPGLGRWTAEWFLARYLGRGDVCPAGDLGVRKAFAHYYGRGREPTERAIRWRAARWGPWQNLAVHYLLAGHRLERAARRGRP